MHCGAPQISGFEGQGGKRSVWNCIIKNFQNHGHFSLELINF